MRTWNGCLVSSKILISRNILFPSPQPWLRKWKWNHRNREIPLSLSKPRFRPRPGASEREPVSGFGRSSHPLWPPRLQQQPRPRPRLRPRVRNVRTRGRRSVPLRTAARRDGAATVAFRKRRSGAPDRSGLRLCATRVGSATSRVGYYPNIDPPVALLSPASCTPTTTERSSRCGGRRRTCLSPTPLRHRRFPVFEFFFQVRKKE